MIDIPNKHIGVQESATNFIQQHDKECCCILDAGAGKKAQARKDIVKRARYISVDVARNHGVTCATDIHSLPFKDSSFNAIICTQVLEHVRDPIRSCKEFYRVMKPGGHILITLPFVWREHANPTDYWRFTSSGCYNLLKEAGFSSIEVVSNGGYLIVLNYILSRLGHQFFGQTFGNVYEIFYKPVSFIFSRLDKLFPHNNYSINFSVTGTKE